MIELKELRVVRVEDLFFTWREKGCELARVSVHLDALRIDDGHFFLLLIDDSQVVNTNILEFDHLTMYLNAITIAGS